MGSPVRSSRPCSTSRTTRDRGVTPLSLRDYATNHAPFTPLMAKDDPVASLIDFVALHDDKYGDQDFHRVVYSSYQHDGRNSKTLTLSFVAHIADQVLTVVSSTACPPLPILVYAIRNILEPSFIRQEIPNLLRLIVHLELLRQDIVRTMQRILRDADNPALPISLDPERRRALDQLTAAKRLAAQRTVYRKIVNGCCLLVCLVSRFFPVAVDTIRT